MASSNHSSSLLWNHTMNRQSPISLVSALTLINLIACTPKVVSLSSTHDQSVSGQIIKYGDPEITLVNLSVKRPANALTWKAECVDGSKEEIIAEDVPGLTILKWKVEKERLKTLTSKPYQLRISNGVSTFTSNVSFTSQGSIFAANTIQEVVVRIMIGH